MRVDIGRAFVLEKIPEGSKPLAGDFAPRHPRNIPQRNPRIPAGMPAPSPPSPESSCRRRSLRDRGGMPEGAARFSLRFYHPFRVRGLFRRLRWCRFAQPPANGCDPAGIRSGAATDKSAGSDWFWPLAPEGCGSQAGRTNQPPLGCRSQLSGTLGPTGPTPPSGVPDSFVLKKIPEGSKPLAGD